MNKERGLDFLLSEEKFSLLKSKLEILESALEEELFSSSRDKSYTEVIKAQLDLVKIALKRINSGMAQEHKQFPMLSEDYKEILNVLKKIKAEHVISVVERSRRDKKKKVPAPVAGSGLAVKQILGLVENKVQFNKTKEVGSIKVAMSPSLKPKSPMSSETSKATAVEAESRLSDFTYGDFAKALDELREKLEDLLERQKVGRGSGEYYINEGLEQRLRNVESFLKQIEGEDQTRQVERKLAGIINDFMDSSEEFIAESSED